MKERSYVIATCETTTEKFLYFFFSKQIEKFLTYNLRKTNTFIRIAIYIYLGTKIISVLFNLKTSYGVGLFNIGWLISMSLYLYFAKNIYFEMKQEHQKVKELTFFLSLTPIKIYLIEDIFTSVIQKYCIACLSLHQASIAYYKLMHPSHRLFQT